MMELREPLILRKPRSGSLDGRRAPVQLRQTLPSRVQVQDPPRVTCLGFLASRAAVGGNHIARRCRAVWKPRQTVPPWPGLRQPPMPWSAPQEKTWMHGTCVDGPRLAHKKTAVDGRSRLQSCVRPPAFAGAGFCGGGALTAGPGRNRKVGSRYQALGIGVALTRQVCPALAVGWRHPHAPSW